MSTIIEDTDQNDIFQALSEPSARKMWDIGLKFAKVDGAVLRL